MIEEESEVEGGQKVRMDGGKGRERQCSGWVVNAYYLGFPAMRCR